MEAIAHKCLEGAESNSMTFLQVVSTLMGGGIRRYLVRMFYEPGSDPGVHTRKPFRPASFA
jgi:hypothetical protein